MSEIPDTDPAPVPPSGSSAKPARFAVLQNRASGNYIGSASLAMMGDNIEHVITYWVMWQLFESPILAGFAVVSHWVPHLLLSVYFGGLADRHDCRRIIQIAQCAFISASLGWGVMFVTGVVEPWMCCVLLIVHGMASAIWHPAEQLMLYDVVGRENLTSAVRLNATGRNLGMLAGPLVGGVLLVTLGPELAIFVNVLSFLPMTILMMVTRYTGHLRRGGVTRSDRLTLRAVFGSVRLLKGKPVLISMMMLGAAGALFIGAALQPLMPEFAILFGETDAGLGYMFLLAANACGAVIGGILLELTPYIRATVRMAIGFTAAFGAAIVVFASAQSYGLALAALILAGFCNLVTTSTQLTIVQLAAPSDQRGTVLGLHGMASMGSRSGSGVVVGGLGVLLGVQLAVGVSAGVLVVVALAILLYVQRSGVPRGELH